jgi:dihydropteroate synthase
MIANRRSLEPFAWGSRTYVMGIINVTPDSFSGDGIGNSYDPIPAAVEQARAFVADGADILDIGGESTRPAGETVGLDEEIGRILPVIRAVRAAVDVPISIDTYRAKTAEVALAAGADWVNDVWGLMHDRVMVGVVSSAECPVVIMHNGRNRKREDKDDQAGGYYGYFHYEDVVDEVKNELMQSVNLAVKAGVNEKNIILDPGVGFGKTGAQSMTLINRLDEIKALGFPILLGSSRKGFIGHILGGLSAEDRVEGTAATVAIGIARGADIVRVHDVRAMKRVAQMTDALVRNGD